MGEIIVKHFRRADTTSEQKELVTEIVVEDSDTGHFLRRVEESRLTRPCFQTIDMRGKVAGECRRYAFNDRIHYLDDLSFQMFERGLHENNGVYTVGTFESIVGGAHTLQAQINARDEAELRRQEIEKRRLQRTRDAARERARVDGVDAVEDIQPVIADNPESLPLGYFRKRDHPRLQFASKVRLQSGNIRSDGITRDISVCGIQVRIKGLTTFQEDQKLQVSLTGLHDKAGNVQFDDVLYRVVRIQTHEADSTLFLRRVDLDGPAGFSDFISGFIEENRRRYKLDVDDEYTSTLSWYYERCHAQSITQLPVFVEKTGADTLRVQAVAMSEGNTYLARFFCTDVDNYDFSPLALPARLERLAEKGEFVMAMYRHKGDGDDRLRLHSAADFEFATDADFYRFIYYAASQPEYSVVKVQVGSMPLLQASGKKIDEISQRLQYKSESRMKVLREQLARLFFVAYVVDMTHKYTGLSMNDKSIDGLQAWVGPECRNLSDGGVKKSLDPSRELLKTDLVRFGYVERRREDRYLAETRVDVKIGDRSLEGLSKDISTRGIRIQLNKCLAVKPGAPVKVGLVSLQQKKSGANLMDIPYLVVNSVNNDEGTVIMLERVLGSAKEGLKEFFVELITKNEHKLGVDTGDIWSATTSRLYESLLAANTPTIPFFLGRNAEGGAHLQFVGVPEGGNKLLDFFETESGHDFRCVNDRRVVTTLYDAIQILVRRQKASQEPPAPFELELYLYRERDEETGETYIHAATELDFTSDAGRETYLQQLVGREDWRCLKIVTTFVHALDEKSVDKLVASVREQSKHRAIKLSDLAHSVVGCGEVIDISRQSGARRGLVKPES
ncbi:PilZ domain-containing protein [Thiogranum longum]|uniref:PilZ domain-containing protein n=1 Tax=Thiogranum longum TaxID=1537524 RepID=A0A4R1H6R4_9GAMM|nr:PilZ domain-containing protein [Thiogranum longum]TCK17457.1 PilZ domain-containing protein [Thiogranum longum]